VKEVVENFLLKSVKRNGVIRIGTYSIGFSIMNYFLEQWGLVEIQWLPKLLVNTVENSVKTNEEIGSREEPDMMFDEYGRWVKLVGKRINDGFENRSRGKKHYINKSLFVFE
jgi:hypothetical protein